MNDQVEENKVITTTNNTTTTATMTVPQLPLPTKIRNVERRTDCTITQKQMDGNPGQWQLTITGTNADQVQAAVTKLKKEIAAGRSTAAGSASGAGAGNLPSSAERAKNDNAKSSLQQNIVALKRKLALQTKIVEAKEKKQRLQLEQENKEKQGQENTVVTDHVGMEATGPVTNPSRQELEKRRDEATRHHSVTYFKHLISKQEHMLAEQQDKIRATKTALTECNDELEAEKSALLMSEQNDLRLTSRGEVLDEMMAETTSKLTQARQRLHTYKLAHGKATVS
jgi:hypothetical protein